MENPLPIFVYIKVYEFHNRIWMVYKLYCSFYILKNILHLPHMKWMCKCYIVFISKSNISVTVNVYTHIGFHDVEEELKRLE